MLAALGILPLLIAIAPSSLALVLTILVEAPIIYACFGRLDRRRAIMACCFVNAVTQPLLYLALPHLPFIGPAQWWLSFAGAEGGVWLAEALLYRACLGCPVARALGASLAANAASAGLGLLLPV